MNYYRCHLNIRVFCESTASGSSTKCIGAHVQSEMPPLPQLPMITVSEPQQQRKSEVSSQANTSTFDKITKKNGDDRERKESRERETARPPSPPDKINPRRASCRLRPARRRRAFWCCSLQMAFVLCSSNRLKLSRKTPFKVLSSNLQPLF